uniref:Uncharacterized protein n=1 Tax=Triticum urartu TaxID=4572 RepID=A0A8R7QRF0_TRIUA
MFEVVGDRPGGGGSANGIEGRARPKEDVALCRLCQDPRCPSATSSCRMVSAQAVSRSLSRCTITTVRISVCNPSMNLVRK